MEHAGWHAGRVWKKGGSGLPGQARVLPLFKPAEWLRVWGYGGEALGIM